MKQSLKGEITSILHATPIVDNLARKTFVALFVSALIQQRKVQFNELAVVLNDEAKIASNQNRIEDFFREVDINFQAIAWLILALLPKKAKLRLTIDRTDRTDFYDSCNSGWIKIFIFFFPLDAGKHAMN